MLVTGGAGFIGSHLLRYLAEKYPTVHFTCIDKLSYVSDHSTKYVDEILQKRNVTFYKKDLAKDFIFLQQLLVRDYNRNKINTILHLASETCVDRSFEDPLGFTTNNILSTQNLLECARLLIKEDESRKDSFRFIHISTDEVYGEQRPSETVAESGNLNPTNPYAATKAAIDLIINSYQYSYAIPIAIIRPNNVYGPRQYPEKIIPMTIDKLKRRFFEGDTKSRVTIHGDGTNTRTYLHVSDFNRGVEIIWRAFVEEQKNGTSPVRGEIFNLGTSSEISNLKLVRTIFNSFLVRKNIEGVSEDDFSQYVEMVRNREYNDARYAVDYSKARRLGWEPITDFVGGINALVDES